MPSPVAPTIEQLPIQIGNTRIIEDKGIYVLSEEELSCWRLRVLVDVIVLPKIQYKSFKPNEPEQYFGAFQLVEGGFVISQANLKFVHQQVYRFQNDPAKALFDAGYIGQMILFDLFQATSAVLSSIPAAATLTSTPFQPGKHLPTQITEIWFRAVPGCKLAVHTEWLPLPTISGQPASVTEPEGDQSPSAPSNQGGDGKPPSDAPPTRPATPPYNPPDNDNGRTTPRGTLPAGGSWKVSASAFDHEDNAYTFVFDTHVANPDTPPTVTVSSLETRNVANKQDGALTVNGTRTSATGFGMTVGTVYYS